MSLFAVLDTTATSLLAQTAGIAVTSNNVANATTPGYVRQSAVLEDQVLGGRGGGVSVAGIRRSFDQFGFQRVASQGGLLGAAQARSSALAQLQATLAPSSGSIDGGVSSFFAATETLAASPTDTTARAQFLSSAQSLAQSISGASRDMAKQRADLLGQAQGVASDVNQSLAQIAKLDQQILQAPAGTDGAAALRDQRDTLVQDVASQLGAQTIEDDQGHFTLLSSGVALVADGSAAQVGVGLDASGDLAITVQSGGAPTDVTKNVTSGTLGGLREARDQDLAGAQQALDQFAYDLSTSVNQTHAAGYGLDGATGRNLFVQPTQVAGAASAMALDPSMDGHPERVAAAASASELPGGGTNAVALAALSSQPLGGGASDPTQRFASIVASVGQSKSSADSETSLREATSAQATNAEQSTEGVNVDEEMVALSQYQTAFQAAQKVLSVTNQLLGELMQAL